MHKLQNSSVSKLTTLRIGGNANNILFPESADELISIFYELKSSKTPWHVLGAGSNTLASSNNFEGALICTTSMNWINKTSNETIVVGPGVRLPKLAGNCMQMQLSGCEFYEGIPGSVGGAIIMNAGAHGSWTSNILEKVSLFDTEKFEIQNLFPSQIDFAYRHSNIDPKRYIILEAKYRLNNTHSQTYIQDTMRKYSTQRNKTQPKGHSAGCVFRNPSTKLFAGQLIDSLGLKGFYNGNAQISNIHANFIINNKNATSNEVCNIIHIAQKQIWDIHKIWLKPEIMPLGNFSQKDQMIWTHPDHRPDNWENLLEA